MSAFGGKADMADCAAYVCFWPEVDISFWIANLCFRGKRLGQIGSLWSLSVGSIVTWWNLTRERRLISKIRSSHTRRDARCTLPVS